MNTTMIEWNFNNRPKTRKPCCIICNKGDVDFVTGYFDIFFEGLIFIQFDDVMRTDWYAWAYIPGCSEVKP